MPILQFSIGIVPDQQFSRTEVQNWFIASLVTLRVKGGMDAKEASVYAWKSWETFSQNLPKKEQDGQ